MTIPMADGKAAAGPSNAGWGSDVVAETIQALGYRYIALVPGASFRGLHDSLVNHLGNRQPQLVVCLHEGQAVSIADGYARVAEEPMAVALHANVGLMQGTMAIFNAWCDRRPMLIIGATGPVDAHKRRPWIDWIHTAKDQAAMIRHYVKWDDQPASPEAAVEAVLRAHQIALTRPYGPAYVCLDAGMQEARLEHPVEVPPVERFRPGHAPAAPQAAVEETLDLLRSARHPLVLIGRGSRRREDWDRRVRLVEALGTTALTSLHNPSNFPTEHPAHLLPPVGERPSDDEKRLLETADVILSLDWHDLAGFLAARLGGAQTQSPAPAKVIHCSLERTIANGWSMDHQALPAVDVPILAEPDQLIAQMAEALAAKGRADGEALKAPPGFAHWTAEAEKRRANGVAGPLTVTDLSFILDDFARTRPVTFPRLPFGWSPHACRFRDPLDYLGKDGGGAVGTGPGHTVGAALALGGSGRLVAGVIGDGDFAMGANALWTASNMRIPMMLIVANNRSYYNDEVHQERMARMRGRPVENKWIGQRMTDPLVDHVGLAKAQGFDGEGPVATAGELRAALARGAELVDAGGRFLIDVHVEPEAD
jgi:thiamine pyrophosphate-dependent acetolactate synthase large subunit-like protein